MNAPELLDKLRAAGVRHLSDATLLEIAERAAETWCTDEDPIHLAADLLEARAQLAEMQEQLANAEATFADVHKLAITATGKVLRVSEWARGMAPDTPGAECAAVVLEILDREPEP